MPFKLLVFDKLPFIPSLNLLIYTPKNLHCEVTHFLYYSQIFHLLFIQKFAVMWWFWKGNKVTPLTSSPDQEKQTSSCPDATDGNEELVGIYNGKPSLATVES